MPEFIATDLSLDDEPVAITGGNLVTRQEDRRGFAWGFVSQGISSATNLGLMLAAGRLLGPSGLGVVAIAFASYITILGFQRALVTEPLVALSATLTTELRSSASGKALTVALIGSFGAASLVVVIGVLAQGDIARALLIVAPWLPALLMQDFWRSVLFRDGRARAAAINDGLWLLTMAAGVPLAWLVGGDYAVVGWWALGGLAGTLLGFAQTQISPGIPRRALVWWRFELWPLGRWLGANSLSYSLITYGIIFVFLGLFGASGLGGYRAVTAIFAPLTLIGSALALPGLPALSRARAVSEGSAVKMAFWLGGLSVAATAAYVGALSIGGTDIVARIFGASFERYTDLVLPVAVGQLLFAASVGFGLLLKAQRRGVAVLVSDTMTAGTSLVAACALGAVYGLTGAAWGLLAGAGVGLVSRTVLVLRH